MVDFRTLREESMFEVDEKEFEVFFEYLGVLTKYPHPFQSLHSNSLEKLYFFQDLWFLSQLGTQYKSIITEKEIVLKKVRLALVEYLLTVEEWNIMKTLSKPERFIFCYRYLMEIVKYTEKRVEETVVHGNYDSYSGAMNRVEDSEDWQQEILECDDKEWFQQGDLLAKIFQEKLVEVKQVYSTMKDVCGLELSKPGLNTEHFIQAVIKTDDLLEIAFWKRNFKEQGLHRLFEQKNQTLSTLVVCAQQSDEMRTLLNMQIGLICALLVISEEEARDFVYIPYAEGIGEEVYCEKGHVTIAQYMDIVQRFLGGQDPPNYCQLLNTVFIMLKLSKISLSGDIVLLCDDKIHAHVPQNEMWQQAVERYKKETNSRIIVLYNGVCHPEMTIWFADRVICINEFQLKRDVM